MNPTDEEWIKHMKTVPTDIQEYIRELIRELWLCYEWMEDKEKFAIVQNEFENRKSIYHQLWYLINNIQFFPKIKKKIKEAKE